MNFSVLSRVLRGILLMTAVAAMAPFSLAATLDVASVSSDGDRGNAMSIDSTVSYDGRYVAFSTLATNLVPGDTPNHFDILRRDLRTGTTARVSAAFNGSDSDDDSGNPRMSVDGRFIAFDSHSTNLAPGDTNGHSDVFVRDMRTGTTRVASLSRSGTFSDGDSYGASISADGRFVAFVSSASNLVSGDTNNSWDVFVHDMQSGATERVNLASDGSQDNMGAVLTSANTALSADGRYVAFSTKGGLLPTDTNSNWDVYVKDRQTSGLTRASVNSSGSQDDSPAGKYYSWSPSISADGRYVAFESARGDLSPDDTGTDSDAFVRDLQTNTTLLVSIGAQVGGVQPKISGDGRLVAFTSYNGVIGNDTNGTGDIYVRDLGTGTSTRVSVTDDGTQAEVDCAVPAINGDGHVVCFMSMADNLVPDDSGPMQNIFVRNDGSPTTRHGVSGRTVIFPPSSDFKTAVKTSLPGVIVNLKDAGGTVLAQRVSDSTGSYNFAGIAPGSYTLVAKLNRTGLAPLILDPAGQTVTVTSADVAVPRFGLYSIFGVVNAPDPAGNFGPKTSVVVTLRDGSGAEAGTRTTASDGRFNFGKLSAGTYSLSATKSGLSFPNAPGLTLPSTSQVGIAPSLKKGMAGTRIIGTVRIGPSGASS